MLFAGQQPARQSHKREVPLLKRLLTRKLDLDDDTASERGEAVIAMTHASRHPRENQLSILAHQMTANEEHVLCHELTCSVHT